MAKITKQQSKLHDEALALVHSDKALTKDDIEFVYKNYNPMASHNVGKGAIYFTPPGLAEEFAVLAPKGRVIDLCAGIGVLSYYTLQHDISGYSGREPFRGDIKRLVAIENNPEFVEVGKRLMPYVEWIHGDVFDLDLLTSLGEFDCAISNPPYGHIPTKDANDWTLVKGPAHWQVIEIALRLADNGGIFILPEDCTDYDLRKRQYNPQKPKNKYLEPYFHDVYMEAWAADYDQYLNDWQGASPKVNIVDISTDDVSFSRPYGFQDVRPVLPLVDVPIVKPERKTLRLSEDELVEEENAEQLGLFK